MNPPLKWAGGKRWLVPTLAGIYRPHRHRRLILPFCGGASEAFGLEPYRAVLNDINPNLIIFYQWLRMGLRNDISVPMCNDADTYYAHRARFNAIRTTHYWAGKEAALLFYYLNRTCFNGLCRHNRHGDFNVAFGRHKTITYTEDFCSYSRPLAMWHFQSGDFEKVRTYPGDFVIADPPYDGTIFTGYYGAWGWADQVRLVNWLSRHEGPVVATNLATDRMVKLYQEAGFRVETLMAPRRISNNGDRTPALEMLAMRDV